MSKKQILGVDGSFIMRTIIKDSVDSDPELEVAGFAENGKIGLQRVRELKPDAILLDLEMPEMSGSAMVKRLGLLRKAAVAGVPSGGHPGAPRARRERRPGRAARRHHPPVRASPDRA